MRGNDVKRRGNNEIVRGNNKVICKNKKVICENNEVTCKTNKVILRINVNYQNAFTDFLSQKYPYRVHFDSYMRIHLYFFAIDVHNDPS